ncbi:cytochrome P450 [Pseudohyphozyma bogoriensis]|nr:cytochrome P450 [Pseudohyphozyma bogoriensis]
MSYIRLPELPPSLTGATKEGSSPDQTRRRDGRFRLIAAVIVIAVLVVALRGSIALPDSLDTPPPPAPTVDAVTGFTKVKAAFAAAPTLTSADNVKAPLCVVARTYGSQLHYLPIFLLSLWNAGLADVRVFLLNTDTSMATADLRAGSDLVNMLVGREDYATFWDWDANTEGDYGYALSDRALEHFYAHPELGCEYLLFTNGDNLYPQNFGRLLKPGFDGKMDLLGFDFITHHQRVPSKSSYDGHKLTVVEPGTALPLRHEFKISSIDLGAAIFRMDTLRANNFTFENTGG